MPIPQFSSNGLLPPFEGEDATTLQRSPYFGSIIEVIERFSTTPARRALLGGLLQYRRFLADNYFTSGIQFIDGSFVEDVEKLRNRDPRDIDVFSLIELPVRYREPDLWQAEGFPFWRDEVVHSKNKDRYSLDTYGEIFRPGAAQIKSLFYWNDLFGHQRDTFSWKGYVMIPLDPAADLQAAETLNA